MQTPNSKYVSCALIAAFTITICALSDTNTAMANDTARQVVTVTIPPIRALYVDEEGRIVAIFSNVRAIGDGKLQVFKGGTEIAVSNEMMNQYKELLPRIDWSKIGWVYQQPNPDPKVPIKAQLLKQNEETNGYLEKECYSGTMIKGAVSEEEIFEIVSKLNSFPQPSYKENYNIRVTVVDAKEGLTKVWFEYFL